MAALGEAEWLLQAAIEFGSQYTYTINHGTLGRTLYIDAGTKERAKEIRAAAPVCWNGLRVLVTYYESREEIDQGVKT